MPTFRRYDHVERLGHSETLGILEGTVYVFPKLDGTNASAWVGDDGTIRAGSRNREISVESDNHGFAKWLLGSDEAADLRDFLLNQRPTWVLYGEWLVPHTVKGYHPVAWRRFYVFDAFDTATGQYVDYAELVDYVPTSLIPAIAKLTHPTAQQVEAVLDDPLSNYLVDSGVGEGIVIKNYGWKNRFGRQPWAKIVRGEFKAKMRQSCQKPHGPTVRVTETKLAEEAVSEALVAKERAKQTLHAMQTAGWVLPEGVTPEGLLGADPSMATTNLLDTVAVFYQNHRSEIIPAVLGRVWHCVVTEELWSLLKKHREPTIDFRTLRSAVYARARSFLIGEIGEKQA